jgi:hypothetical protein
MNANTGIETYQKVQSSACGYADLAGAVFNDDTIFTEVSQFYSFYDGSTGAGYVTDTEMTGPEACAAHCESESTCTMVRRTGIEHRERSASTLTLDGYSRAGFARRFARRGSSITSTSTRIQARWKR